MEEQLDFAPCGYLALTDEGKIETMNQTLLDLVGYERQELLGENINEILDKPAQTFCQLYLFPLMKLGRKVEELYLSLRSKAGDEIPVLINGNRRKNENGNEVNECVLIPMYKRNEYENEILQAKKIAEHALSEKAKANEELRNVLEIVESQKNELLQANKQNEKYQERMTRELDLAKQIQHISLTPQIKTNEIDITTFYEPSSELSGDIFGCYQINEQQYGIIILDVMGHGVSSALITMSLRSLFEGLILKGSAPDVVLCELDRYLQRLFQYDVQSTHYVTGIYLLIDTKKQQIEYLNAGHPSAIWLDGDGQQTELSSSLPPLGMLEGLVFKTRSFSYTNGGRLLLYTDGVTDIIPYKKVVELVHNHHLSPTSDLKKGIVTQLQMIDANLEQDDQCFIIVDL
ncbi:SpoIIE family protein phosphatase [Alkalihalobacillus sp. LMS39]|uniref:SpoIIE family protein phosphatase n=1 Tax=Alkalihalobacillus sp. LMS39 TaxID=2924032 RepID=UPI001FB33D38|nr:SpoIIE family protein phosphatase [Alkalihalobacillus sp. LMS39]UOE94568.1 SpoIIE family protein phosphatase [Alkalihalobacillus sp. LMS39]